MVSIENILSQRNNERMVVVERFKFFVRIFQCVGLTPIFIKAEDNKMKSVRNNFVNFIPTSLTSVAVLSLAYFLLRNPHFASSGPIHVIISSTSIISLTLISMTGNFQCFFNKSLLRQINSKISQIEQRMDESDAPIKSLYAGAYKMKMFLMFLLFFASQGLVFYEVSQLSGTSMLSSFFTSLIRFIFPTAISHVVLYCDTVANCLHQLNAKITNTPAIFHISVRVDLLKSVKLIHMDLWKVVVLINRYFGCNLLFLVVNSFMYIILQLYWIFVALQTEPEWEIPVIEGVLSGVYGVVSIFILSNACQSCSKEVKNIAGNIEQCVFWTSDNEKVHALKLEIFHQVNHLSMDITASDFIRIDRQLVGHVFTSLCMYIVTIIQFYVTNNTKS